jgi:hypothetical protein
MVDEGLTAHGRSSSMWKISDVMEVSIPNGVGYGFNVTTEGRKPLVLLSACQPPSYRPLAAGGLFRLPDRF